MKIKWKGGGKVKIWSVGSVGLVMLLVILTATTASAQSVTLKPSTTEPLVNDTFTVDVVVSDVGSIIGLKANISYTDNLEYLGVDYYPSGWMKLSDDPIRVFTVNKAVDTTNGATIVKLKFKALSEGNATITLSNIKVKDVDDNIHNLGDANTIVTVTKIINITAIKVEVEPKELTWGRYNDITVTVTTPEDYPVEGANVTLIGVDTEFIYGTKRTNESGVAVFKILPSSDDTKIKVNVEYWNGTAWLMDTTNIAVKAPKNITYVYGYARIENTEVPVPLNNTPNVRIYVYVTNGTMEYVPPRPSTPYCVRNTTENGEFVFALQTPPEARKLYIWIETEVKSIGKYVTAKFSTTEYPGYVPIEPGTTSVQANVPVRAEINVTYPDNLVVQVFNDLSGVWSNDRTCCEECIDTLPKKADGVSKFKVRAQLRVGNEPYNLTDLENALAELGITSKLPDYVHVCVNDTKIAVVDENGQRCADIKFVSKDNSTAIFYVRSNAPTDPSELKSENTGIVNITGWYNYTAISGTEPANVPEVNSLTDYDCADFEGTGFIAGEVVDGETQHSIVGAKVYVKWFNGTAWVNATDFKGNQIVTTSDEHGHYKLEVISGRDYKVYAEKEGYKGCAPSQVVYVQLGTTTTADVVLVKNSITKPDLTVESITVGTPVVNETVTVKAKIANVGDADAGAFNVSLYANDTLVGNASVESLAAGANTTVEFSWTPTEAKTYVLKVVVDVDNAVDESNETNNEKTVTVVSFKMGDANGDCKVTAADAMFIAQYVAGVRAELPNPAAADVYPDDEINAIDAMYIAQYLAGLRPSLG